MKKGFVLAEALLVIFITSIVVLLTYSIVNMRVNEEGIVKDKINEIEEEYELCLRNIIEVVEEDPS